MRAGRVIIILFGKVKNNTLFGGKPFEKAENEIPADSLNIAVMGNRWRRNGMCFKVFVYEHGADEVNDPRNNQVRAVSGGDMEFSRDILT